MTIQPAERRKRSERRKHMRYIANGKAELFVSNTDTQQLVGAGAVTDISRGGLRFESNIEFDQNNVLVKFSLPGKKTRFSFNCLRVRARKEADRLIYGFKIEEAKCTEKMKLWLYLVANKAS